MLRNARDGTGYVRLAIDHVTLIHHDRRNAGDAQAPGVGNALVCRRNAALEVGTAVVQAALDDGRGLLRIGGQLCGKLGFDARAFIQLDQPLATHGLDRVAAVGDDHHIGGEGGWAENGQGCRQCNGQAKGSPAGCEAE